MRKTLVLYATEALVCCTRQRDGHFRVYIWILLALAFSLAAAAGGTQTVIRFFVLGAPLNWSVSIQAYFFAFSAVVRLIVSFALTVVLKKLKFHETTIFLIGMTSMLLNTLLTGVARNSRWMYASAALGSAIPLIFPAGRSLVAQCVDSDETGKIYAVSVLVGVVGGTVGAVTANRVYTETAQVIPGLTFLIFAGLILAAFVPTLWMHIHYWRWRISREQTPSQIVHPHDAAL